MKSEEKMRGDFEAWQIEEGLTDPMWFEPGWFDEKNQEYRLDKVNSDWSIWKAAWKASRESLVIDLPRKEKDKAWMDDYDSGCVYGRNEVIESCKYAIHAAGVKTK